MGLSLNSFCFSFRWIRILEPVVAEVCGNLRNRGAHILIAESNSVAKWDHQGVVLECRWTRIFPQQDFKNSTKVEWLRVREKTFLKERKMAGRVKHLDGPCAAIEDPVGVFHTGVEARLADVAEEGSDQRPEVEGVRWNRGWSLCKKTRYGDQDRGGW